MSPSSVKASAAPPWLLGNRGPYKRDACLPEGFGDISVCKAARVLGDLKDQGPLSGDGDESEASEVAKEFETRDGLPIGGWWGSEGVDHTAPRGIVRCQGLRGERDSGAADHDAGDGPGIDLDSGDIVGGDAEGVGTVDGVEGPAKQVTSDGSCRLRRRRLLDRRCRTLRG